MGGIAAAAIIGAGTAYYGASEQKKASQKGTRSKVRPLGEFLPPELARIFMSGDFNPAEAGPGYNRETGQYDTDLGRAVAALMQQAGYGLPDAVKQRGYGNIASGFGGALDASNRNAALGFGPQALSPAMTEISRARASANFGADFEAQSQQKRMEALAPLLSFFSNMQALRYGNPSTVISPYTGPSPASAALSGAGAGIGAYNSFTGGRSRTSTSSASRTPYNFDMLSPSSSTAWMGDVPSFGSTGYLR
jgi:hypothetical protein